MANLGSSPGVIQKDQPNTSLHSPHSQKTPELQRHLSNRHIQLIAIGGAIGTGIFMGAGKTISVAGPSILLVYIVIGVAVFFLMRAMGEVLLSDYKYGTFADFAEDLLGPWAGFIVGWTYWLCWVITGMAEIIAIVGYVHFWWPDLPSWIPAAVTTLLLFSLNALTVKAFGETEFWFAMIKIVAIVALIIAGLVLVLTHFHGASVTHLWDHGGVFPRGFPGFMAGFQIAIFAFVGIELVGTTAGETAAPEKSLPKAINAIPVRVLLFYVLSLAAIMTVTPWDQIRPEQSPFVTMFSIVGLVSAATVVNVVVLSSAASSCNSGIYSTSRMLFGLARRGNAPAWFGKLSANLVPHRAIALTALLLLGSVLIIGLGDSVISSFTLATTVASTLFMGIWFSILLSYLAYRRKFPHKHSQSIFPLPGGNLAIYGVMLFLLFVFYALWQESDTRLGIIISLGFFGFISLIYIGLSKLSRFADSESNVSK